MIIDKVIDEIRTKYGKYRIVTTWKLERIK